MTSSTNALAASTPIEPAEQRPFRDETLALVELLARSARVPFDQTEAFERLMRAELDIPGTWHATWIDRLKQIGGDLGMSVIVEESPKRQVLEVSNEQALFTYHPEMAAGHWLIIKNRKIGEIKPQENSLVNWKRSRELQTQLTAEEARSAASCLWICVEPAKPCEPLHSKPAESHRHGPSPFRRLLGLLRQEKNDLWVIALFSLGIGIFSLATPIAVEAIVSTVQGGTQILLQPVIVLSIVLLVFLTLAVVLRVFKAFVVEYLQQRIFVRVVVDLANRLPKVSQEALDREHGPELVNRFFDVLTVQKASAVLLVDGLSVVLQTAIGLMVLGFFNPYLLGFDLVLIGAIAFIVFILGHGAVPTSIKESYAKYEVAGWLEEIVRHPLTFKLAGGRDYALLRANQLAGNYVHARRAHFRIVFRQILFALLLQAFASAALFGLGGWLVINRGLTLGQLVAAELILAMIVGSLIKLGKSLESYYDLMAAVDKLGHLIDLPLENPDGESFPSADRAATIRMRHLTFMYADRGKPILDQIDLSVGPGQHLAIVGPNGSGKSTLLDLLYGLRRPTKGQIEIDGANLNQLRLDSLRRQVSLVEGIEIFKGTIAQNIAVGRPLSMDQVRQALDTVGLLDEIQRMPDGIHTPLSTGGVPLSNGQVRRLMMARAIITSPRLLLIDEVLDDLHESKRDQILQRLTDAKKPWTMIVTTHSNEVAKYCKQTLRLSKPEFADNISPVTDAGTT